MPLQSHEKRTLIFLARHLVAGTGGAVVLGGLLLWFDIGEMWSLMVHSDRPFLYMFMLFFSLVITFGSISMGIGIMSMSDDDAP